MTTIVEKALPLWGLINAPCTLIAARENVVYRVTTADGPVALRLHRKGYRTDQELWSELKWMAAVAQGGITVPTPIPSQSGAVLHIVDGTQVDVLTWLPGAPLVDIIADMTPQNRAKVFHKLGHEMARLHQVSDDWALPDGFTRCAWDRDGLLGETPLWDRFWDNPALSPDDRQLLLNMRGKARAELTERAPHLDFGLIHADLVSANVMIDGDHLSLIDFDDGGFGFRLYELATALLKFIDDPDYPDLRTALINGYTNTRALDLTALDTFMVLRAATYVGWNISRMEEGGAADRNARFINTARRLAQAYLS